MFVGIGYSSNKNLIQLAKMNPDSTQRLGQQQKRKKTKPGQDYGEETARTKF